jgi:hypothetical protein
MKEKQVNIAMNRLKISRLWIMIATSYYFFRALFIIYPESSKSTPAMKAIEILQGVICGIIVGTIIYSFKYNDLWCMKYLLFMQAVQMMLSNFNVYSSNIDLKATANVEGIVYNEDGYANFEGLNMLSSVFSVMFNLFNSLFMVFVFDNKIVRYSLVGTIFVLQIIILIATNFTFENLSSHAIIAIVIAIAYQGILVPAFLYLTNAILQETIDEANIS